MVLLNTDQDAIGMILVIVIFSILGFIFRYFKNRLRTKPPIEDKKMQYLSDKFMSLKNTIDKNWEREIIDIEISPPFHKKGYWTVKKHINNGEDFEIYKKTDEELELEMKQPKENVIDILVSLPTWTCNKCNEENEGSFDSCWKCQTSIKME